MSGPVKVAVVDALRDEETATLGSPRLSRYLACVANRPLIAHVIDSLAQSGVERIAVGARPWAAQAIASAMRDCTTAGTATTLVECGAEAGMHELLSTVREMCGDDPLLAHSGDCLFPRQLEPLAKRFNAGDVDLAVLVRPPAGRARSPLQLVDRDDRIRLPRSRPAGTMLILGARAWPSVESDSGDQLALDRLIDRLRAAGGRIGTWEASEHWCFSDSPEDLLAANRMVLDNLPAASPRASVGKDCEVQGRVVVARSARVSGSTLRGPVLIGPRAVIEDSFIGPYTAIGTGARVTGAEIDYAMVLADAEVSYPGSRLQGSVIGERALVTQSLSVPAGLHVQVGPGARVILG